MTQLWNVTYFLHGKAGICFIVMFVCSQLLADFHIFWELLWESCIHCTKADCLEQFLPVSEQNLWDLFSHILLSFINFFLLFYLVTIQVLSPRKGDSVLQIKICFCKAMFIHTLTGSFNAIIACEVTWNFHTKKVLPKRQTAYKKLFFCCQIKDDFWHICTAN